MAFKSFFISKLGGLFQFIWFFLKIFVLKFGGGLIICYIIWARVLRKRAMGPINLNFTELKFYIYIFLVCSFVLGLLLILASPIFFLIRTKVITHPNENTNTFSFKFHTKIMKYTGKVSDFYNLMLVSFYSPIMNKFLDNTPPFWFKFLNFILKHCDKTMIILNIFYFLPPCIISLTYFLEVIIYREFTYFPYVVFLMIFPLGIRAFIFHVQYFCVEIKNELSTYIKVVKKCDDGDIYNWVDDFDEKERSLELLQVFLTMKSENKALIELFEVIKSYLYTANVRIFYNLFSILCWLSSFSFFLYFMVLGKYF